LSNSACIGTLKHVDPVDPDPQHWLKVKTLTLLLLRKLYLPNGYIQSVLSLSPASCLLQPSRQQLPRLLLRPLPPPAAAPFRPDQRQQPHGQEQRMRRRPQISQLIQHMAQEEAGSQPGTQHVLQPAQELVQRSDNQEGGGGGEGDEEVQQGVEEVLGQLAGLPGGEGVLAGVRPQVLQAR
jgi:hypothetical protein